MLGLAALPSFRTGRNWDLAYCQGAGFNPGVTPSGPDVTPFGPGVTPFDPDRHAAFARFSDDEMWVVVCNFSDTAAVLDIVMPPELGSRTVSVLVAPWDYCAVRI